MGDLESHTAITTSTPHIERSRVCATGKWPESTVNISYCKTGSPWYASGIWYFDAMDHAFKNSENELEQAWRPNKPWRQLTRNGLTTVHGIKLESGLLRQGTIVGW